MAAFLTGVSVLGVTFFLLPLLFYLPRCVLASIICVVVFSILAEGKFSSECSILLQIAKIFAHVK